MFGYQRRRDRARCAHAAGRSEGALAQADGFGGAGRCDLVAETLCRSIVAAKRNAEGKCGACRGERKLAAFSKPSRNYGTPIPSSGRSEEHTSELQSLMRNSYAVLCLKKKKNKKQ